MTAGRKLAWPRCTGCCLATPTVIKEEEEEEEERSATGRKGRKMHDGGRGREDAGTKGTRIDSDREQKPAAAGRARRGIYLPKAEQVFATFFAALIITRKLMCSLSPKPYLVISAIGVCSPAREAGIHMYTRDVCVRAERLSERTLTVGNGEM